MQFLSYDLKECLWIFKSAVLNWNRNPLWSELLENLKVPING